MGQRLMRVAGSPLGQPASQHHQGFHRHILSENNGTGTERESGVEGEGEARLCRIETRGQGGTDRYWNGEMEGFDFWQGWTGIKSGNRGIKLDHRKKNLSCECLREGVSGGGGRGEVCVLIQVQCIFISSVLLF